MAETQIILLRGINVGKAKRIAMADLRKLLENLGYTEVRTLLNSGNACGRSPHPAAKTEKIVSQAIAAEFGFSVDIIVRTRKDIENVVALNPIKGADATPKYYNVLFLSGTPKKSVIDSVTKEAKSYLPEKFAAHGKELYVYCPEGSIASEVLKAVADKNIGVSATARNWNTVVKLLDLAAE